MENPPIKIKQIAAALLATIIFVFSVGSSIAESGTKSHPSSHRQACIKMADSNHSPLAVGGQRDFSVVHSAFIQTSSVVLNANIPFARYITCQAFFVNSHIRNAIYALPTIHAP